MQTIMNNTAGLGLVVNLNWDRMLYIATIVVSLVAGAWLGTIAQPY